NYQTHAQEFKGELKSAPKIHKGTCKINWHTTSEEIYNFVRGLSPYPSAWTSIHDSVHKIYAVKILPGHLTEGAPGTYRTDNKTFLHFKTVNSWISIEELQMEGKKRMTVEEYLRGNKLAVDN